MQVTGEKSGRERLAELMTDIGQNLGRPDAFLDLLLGAVGSSVVVTDPRHDDNPIVYVSKGFERLTGYKPSEALGKNCRFLQGKDRDQSALQELRKAIKRRESVRVTLRNYKKNGTEFLNELSVSPIFDAKGEPVLFAGVQKDVTELRALEQSLAEAEARERHLRELSQLEGLIGGARSSATARSLGVGTLKESSPQLFKKLVGNYNDVLECALEQRAYQVERDLTARLRDLAASLAAVRSGARDVIDLHTTSLKAKRQAANPERARAYAEEGRLLVLELMGLVLNEYRPYSFGTPRGTTEKTKAAGEETRD